MKSYSIVLLVLLSFLTFSCSDILNDTDIGTGIQPTSDQIKVGADTIHVTSQTIFVDYILARQDSFLLGSFYDTKYGSTQAEILAQVNCPIGFRFPPNSIADSALVVLYYNTWFGDSYSPMDVNIYEINKSTFQYSTPYPTNLDPAVYTDRSILLGHRIVTAQDALLARKGSVVFKMSDSFVERFFPTTNSYYTSESEFTNNFFGGMYIKANYGAATMLNVRQIDLLYYYHYTYNKNGKDTVVNNVLPFPANPEVRQVNRFLHPDRNTVVKPSEEVNYISSPANLQTRVNIPLKRIKEKMDAKITNKKLTVNSALLRVEATEVEQATLAQPLVSYMLLIKESAIDDFFKKKELPSATNAILSQIASAQIGTTGEFEYFYTFNLATLVANEMKIAGQNPLPENLQMMLVPVRVGLQSSSSGTQSITSVTPQFLMSAVTIRSGKNKISPMRINMVYSGF